MWAWILFGIVVDVIMALIFIYHGRAAFLGALIGIILGALLLALIIGRFIKNVP